MVPCMKTTIEIPDALLLQAKKAALERRISLKTLVQRGLERELQSPSPSLPHPLDALKSLDPSVWNYTPADAFAKEQRAGWE